MRIRAILSLLLTIAILLALALPLAVNFDGILGTRNGLICGIALIVFATTMMLKVIMDLVSLLRGVEICNIELKVLSTHLGHCVIDIPAFQQEGRVFVYFKSDSRDYEGTIAVASATPSENQESFSIHLKPRRFFRRGFDGSPVIIVFGFCDRPLKGLKAELRLSRVKGGAIPEEILVSVRSPEKVKKAVEGGAVEA